MEIGFTGTQSGMTTEQQVAVASLLDVLCKNGGHVHHGDCIGADAEFHALAKARNLRIEIHPPVKDSKRARLKGDTLWPEYDYLTRNRHIVNSAEVLIATPGGEEIKRSGTWYTIRRAREKHMKIYIVKPSGKIEEEN